MNRVFSFRGVDAGEKEIRLLRSIDWEIRRGEIWGILGGNGSGKTSLGRLLAGELEILTGEAELPPQTALVSFEQEEVLLENERYLDDTDFLDHFDPGTLVEEYLSFSILQRIFPGELESLGIDRITGRGIRQLSTGERRKVLILKALEKEPDCLILDEPFDGLDRNSCRIVSRIADLYASRGGAVCFLLGRRDELPAGMSHFGYLRGGSLTARGAREEAGELLRSLDFLRGSRVPKLPDADPEFHLPAIAENTPLVEMHNVAVSYGDQQVLRNFDWTVRSGEHWMITGPNGCGKSTLLSLVSGDHPQGYANDLQLFGRQRGSGESIWDIKRQIGLVSGQLHQDYRVRVSTVAVIVSGYFDSIGVYQTVSPSRRNRALEWLETAGLADLADIPFHSLSYGRQRMVLVLRAMVKHPRLLILDEPCQGLDDLNRENLLAQINLLACSGTTTLLYVTHHIEDSIPSIKRHLDLGKEAIS